jgi:hypothetical protein
MFDSRTTLAAKYPADKKGFSKWYIKSHFVMVEF